MKLVTAVLLSLALPGCAGGRPAPVAALDAYSRALGQGDYESAYGMMSEEFREAHDKAEFVRLMKENQAEVRETAARLGGEPRSVRVAAELRFGGGDRLRMVLEGSAWRVASNPVAFYAQTTPRDALRSFVRAYRLKRWDMMLALIPSQYAGKMTPDEVRFQFEGPRAEDVEMMMQQLEANIDAPIREKGGEARMPYADAEVRFVREEGRWKIQDPD